MQKVFDFICFFRFLLTRVQRLRQRKSERESKWRKREREREKVIVKMWIFIGAIQSKFKSILLPLITDSDSNLIAEKRNLYQNANNYKQIKSKPNSN